MCAVLAATAAADDDDAKSLRHRSMFSQLTKTGTETETKQKHLENIQEHSESADIRRGECSPYSESVFRVLIRIISKV